MGTPGDPSTLKVMGGVVAEPDQQTLSLGSLAGTARQILMNKVCP